ncbi:hypothetical protein EMPS_01739 [Entomortierella parvispora]|uniref:F-box domain-containing protein n=1 Tax=Entomortierella parvispora TaxID=205924 RepID=A0A9P3H3G5_9FUNG|nr:hypothetical protein EMPS_01739 [Entomortierella parvispora]
MPPSQMSLVDKVLGAPELAIIIGSFLDLDSLVRVSLISKQIHLCFARSIWQDYKLDRGLQDVPSSGLYHSRLSFLRTVEFQTPGTGLLDRLLEKSADPLLELTKGSSGEEQPCVTRLTRLVYSGDIKVKDETQFAGHQLDQVLQLLKQNLFLETVRLPASLIHKHSDELVAVLSTLPRLTSVTLASSNSKGYPMATVFRLLTSLLGFPNLEVLRFSLEVDMARDSHEDNVIFGQTLRDLDGHKRKGLFPRQLKSFELPRFKDRYPSTFLVPLYGSGGFQALETLYIPRSEDRSFESMGPIVRRSFPTVNSILMDGRETNENDDSMFQTIVRQLAPRIRSVEFSCMEWNRDIKFSVLDSRLVLETLIVRNVELMASFDVQIILAACPNLRTFSILGKDRGLVLNFKDFDIYEEEVDIWEDLGQFDDLAANCSCRGLKSFALTSAAPVLGAHPSSTRAFYWQLGRLTELEEITFGYQPWRGFEIENDWLFDFTLNPVHGRLNELRNLKKLRKLHLQGLLWNRIGQAEVEWMEREWPCLERVTVSTATRPAVLEESKSHWQWFMKKRLAFKVRNIYDCTDYSGTVLTYR